MNPENIKMEGTSSESEVHAEGHDRDPHFKDKGIQAGGPVMRAGTDKDWRSAPNAGSSETSGGSDGESIGPTDEAQNEAPDRKPSDEPQREGTWKDWRSAEGPVKDVPKSDQSPGDQKDKGASEPGPMRDGTLRKP